MAEKKIVKVEIVDKDVCCGENPVQDIFYLINPDREKLEELKKMIETRFDYQVENLTDEEVEKAENFCNNIWDEIYKFIEENFETNLIDEVFEIKY